MCKSARHISGIGLGVFDSDYQDIQTESKPTNAGAFSATATDRVSAVGTVCGLFYATHRCSGRLAF